MPAQCLAPTTAGQADYAACAGSRCPTHSDRPLFQTIAAGAQAASGHTRPRGLFLHGRLSVLPTMTPAVQGVPIADSRSSYVRACYGGGLCNGGHRCVCAGQNRRGTSFGNGHRTGEPGPGRKVVPQDDPGNGPFRAAAQHGAAGSAALQAVATLARDRHEPGRDGGPGLDGGLCCADCGGPHFYPGAQSEGI